MKTKTQKTKQIEGGIKSIEGNRTLVFADFTGTKVNELNLFRKSLNSIGAKFEVFRKRLLRIMLEKKGIKIDPEEFEGQVGVAFSSNDIEGIAGEIFKFKKQNKSFKILGGFDIETSKLFSAEEVEMIGKLPPREILLAQLVGTIAAPISSLLYVFTERSKQVN